MLLLIFSPVLSKLKYFNYKDAALILLQFGGNYIHVEIFAKVYTVKSCKLIIAGAVKKGAPGPPVKPTFGVILVKGLCSCFI